MEEQQYLETADIETASDDYASRFAGEVGRFFLDRQLALTLAILQRYDAPAILDVGGGHAQLAVPLARRGYRVTVTGSADHCEDRLKRELQPDEYSYVTCDSLRLPWEDDSFEVVMAFRLLPHTDRWRQLVGELVRVSRRGVIVDYPDIRSSNILNAILFKAKKAAEGNTRPFTLFSRNQICGAFKTYGCTVEGLHPEFLLPMVVHRKVGSASFSAGTEKLCARLGLTAILGSPIIAHFRKGRTP